MADGKKSFLLYTDVHFTVKKLTDEQAGILFKHILSYVNDENPVFDEANEANEAKKAENLILEVAFEPIKQSLKRDLRRYEEIIEKRSNAGRLGGLKSGEIRGNKKEANEANASKTKQTKQTQANEAVNVSVSVIDSVIDNVIDNDNKKRESEWKIEKNLKSRETIFVSEVWQYKEQYTDEMLKNFINYWTETNKSKTKMLWETKPTFEISKRLVTWASRDNEFNNKSNSLLSESDRQRLKESGIYGKT